MTLRILLVEDDLEIGDELQSLLTEHGHRVLWARDPSQALHGARTFIPQFGILDIGLPVMSGYELLAALRALPELAGCRYLALTAHASPNDIEKSLEAGFEHHLVKPVASRILLERLATSQGLFDLEREATK